MTPTLRRLNDRERYYGLTWPGWVALAVSGAVLYGAARISPFGLRATVTVVVLVIAFVASVAPRPLPARALPLPPAAQAPRATN
jgi:hypothetical protein